MNIFEQILNSAKLGGAIMYPLIILFIAAAALTIDKILIHKKLTKLPKDLLELIETYDFSWQELEEKLKNLPTQNFYRSFFSVILQNKTRPVWWLESRSEDEAKLIEKSLAGGLWILETIVTVAPLLGLLGTIAGMMESFKLIGDDSLINPTGVTAGVAQALIATAFGLGIAILSLFAFNYFSRRQDQLLDELERLGTRMIDHIRLDREEK